MAPTRQINKLLIALIICSYVVLLICTGSAQSAATTSSDLDSSMPIIKDVDVTPAAPAPTSGSSNQITIDAENPTASSSEPKTGPSPSSHNLQSSTVAAPSAKQALSSKLVRSTEKLKRGLSKFMNHMNPAPFFVPPAQPSSSAAMASQQHVAPQSEPVAIVGSDGASTGEVLIAKPNRVAQTRHFGGPPRWGR